MPKSKTHIYLVGGRRKRRNWYDPMDFDFTNIEIRATSSKEAARLGTRRLGYLLSGNLATSSLKVWRKW